MIGQLTSSTTATNSGNTPFSREKLREFEVRKAVEKELAKRRKDANLTQNHRAGVPHRIGETGDSRDIAARKAGLGHGSTAEKALQALLKSNEKREGGPWVEAAAELDRKTRPGQGRRTDLGMAHIQVEKPAPGTRDNIRRRLEKYAGDPAACGLQRGWRLRHSLTP